LEEQGIRIFDQFRKEVWIMSGLHHPNVVSLKGFCLHPYCIVMEYMPDGNLQQLLANAEVCVREDASLLYVCGITADVLCRCRQW